MRYRNHNRNINNKAGSGRRERRIRRRLLKIVSIVIIFAASLSAVLILSSNAVKTNASVHTGTKYYSSVIIEPGDTLWTIACRYMDHSAYADVREFINELRSINSLGSDNIKSGNYLIIPYYLYE